MFLFNISSWKGNGKKRDMITFNHLSDKTKKILYKSLFSNLYLEVRVVFNLYTAVSFPSNINREELVQKV